jgi:hypothetical protein
MCGECDEPSAGGSSPQTDLQQQVRYMETSRLGMLIELR